MNTYKPHYKIDNSILRVYRQNLFFQVLISISVIISEILIQIQLLNLNVFSY